MKTLIEESIQLQGAHPHFRNLFNSASNRPISHLMRRFANSSVMTTFKYTEEGVEKRGSLPIILPQSTSLEELKQSVISTINTHLG